MALATLTVTEARKDMSRFVDTVLHEQPAVRITRNRDAIVAVSEARFRHLLAGYRFTLQYGQEVDGSFYGSVKEIPDIIGYGSTNEEMRRDLAEYLREYAAGYAAEINLFYHAPNRRSHFPHVMHVLLQDSVEDVMALIDG